MLGMLPMFPVVWLRYGWSVGGGKRIGLSTGRGGARKCARRHILMITHPGQWDFTGDTITQSDKKRRLLGERGYIFGANLKMVPTRERVKVGRFLDWGARNRGFVPIGEHEAKRRYVELAQCTTAEHCVGAGYCRGVGGGPLFDGGIMI